MKHAMNQCVVLFWLRMSAWVGRAPVLIKQGAAFSMWSFDQPPHCATIVSKSVIERRKPILYVAHDEDDHGWQFLDNESEALDDLCIVGLAHVLDVDPSMSALAGLAPGWQATRVDVQAEWVIEPLPPEVEEVAG